MDIPLVSGLSIHELPDGRRAIVQVEIVTDQRAQAIANALAKPRTSDNGAAA
jgi:hypothetical protein